MDPIAQRKNSLMRSACAWSVCARYMYCIEYSHVLVHSGALGLVDELLHQRSTITSATRWWSHAPPRGALRRLDRLAYGRSRGLSSDRAGRLRSIQTSKVSSKSIFLFCRKCAICDFPSETSATPLPPFRNALRLEKNCELMRCSLRPMRTAPCLESWSGRSGTIAGGIAENSVREPVPAARSLRR